MERTGKKLKAEGPHKKVYHVSIGEATVRKKAPKRSWKKLRGDQKLRWRKEYLLRKKLSALGLYLKQKDRSWAQFEAGRSAGAGSVHDEALENGNEKF